MTITGFKDPNQKAQKIVLPDMIDGRFVTAIAPSAFENSASGMTEVFFPVFCVDIGDKAFKSVPTITNLVFSSVRDWRTPTEPAALRIGQQAFYGARGLTELTFCAEIAELGDFAFYNARGLRDITIPGKPTLGSNVFRGAGLDAGGVTLHVSPAAAGDDAYMTKLTQGMKNVTVQVDDVVVTGLRIRALSLMPAGRVTLSVSVETSPEGGAVAPSSIGVRYYAQLGGAGQVLTPVSAVLEEDGSVTLVVDKPDGDRAFE